MTRLGLSGRRDYSKDQLDVRIVEISCFGLILRESTLLQSFDGKAYTNRSMGV